MRTTKQIIASIYAGIVNELKKVMPLFKESDPLDKTVEQGIAIAIGPELKQLERLGVETAKQGCPLTASSKRDSSIGSLEDWGYLKLNRLPDKPVGGRYSATFTGTGTASAGTQYINQETGFVYILESDVLTAGEGTIQSVGNDGETVLSAGTELYAQQNTGLDDIITISSILTYPEDEETTESYRADVVDAFRVTPRGGAVGDYRIWSLEISGVFKAFPYTLVPTEGIVYIMAPRTDINPYGTVTLAKKNEVLAYLKNKEPMTTGEVFVFGMNLPEYAVEVVGLSDVTKQSLVLPALKEYFADKYPFIDGIDNEDLRTDRVTKVDIFKAVYDAVYPAGITDVIIKRSGLTITDEYLPMGSIGVPSVTFS